MVIGAFPAAKLGVLLIRQISKPIANYIIHKAKTSPVFKTYICMPPAQFYNWCEVKTKMWILNLGKPVNVPVLNEAMAIELGANLLGEAIIFFIASGLVVFEYNRSSRKEAAKEAAKADEMNALNTEIQEMFFQMEQQRVMIKELLRTVASLETQITRKPSQLPVFDDDSSKPSSPKSPPSGGSVMPSPKAILDEVATENKSLVIKATKVIETDFFNKDSNRDKGILTLAINHLYKDVCKLPLYVH